MPQGTILSLRPNRDDGYGFGTITPDEAGPDLVFYSRGAEGAIQVLGRLLHNLRHTATRRERPFDLLRVGQRVTFVVGDDPRRNGRARAERVWPSAS